MRDHEKSRRRLAAPLALLLGAAAFAAPTAAQAVWANSTFAGSNCRTGTYIANALETFTLGEGPVAPELFCPIPRMHPSWPNLQVEVYFYDTTPGSGGTSSGTASCTLTTSNATATGGGITSASVGQIDPVQPLFLSLTNTDAMGGPSWTSITSTSPAWRQARLSCNGMPATANLVTYDVWEGQ
jgi:hypothetical protein